ncbi:MAG: coiled-coil domain-containing protein [Luteibaculum sp.]
MNQDQKNWNWKEIPPREKLYLGVIAALVVVCAFLAWQYFENKTTVQNISLYNDSLEQDKEALNQELDEMLAQYNELETDNKELQSEILNQKDRIEELQKEIEKSKGNIALIRKYKKEVGTLRTIMKGYVVTIDSLNTLNQNLMYENTSIKRELSSTRDDNQRLSTQKKDLENIVKKASVLTARNLLFEGIRLRNNGKQVETNRANKVELLKTCFTLEENVTTKPGRKNIYMVISDSDGNVMYPKQSDTDGEAPPQFTALREIEYLNREMEVCIYANLEGEELPEGDYSVKLIEAGETIGKATTSFK